MFRKDSIIVKEWLENSNKALLVTGARQIGKTWLVRDEIEKSGYNKYEVNFIDQPDMIAYLNAQMSAEEFLVKLKILMPEECKPHKTVVFFDEIQKCPEIVTKIKFLVDEGSFKYVMSGSLLGVELKGIASAPVGYLSVLKMYPMDFEEFMIANNVSNATLDMLKEKFVTGNSVDEFIHQKLLTMFFVYLIVGGMPDAVKTYIETKDIREVDKVQRDIVTLYKEDFSQYEVEDKKLKLKSIYDIIPAELNKQNKKFIFTMLDKELKFNRYENSLSILSGSPASEAQNLPFLQYGQGSQLPRRVGQPLYYAACGFGVLPAYEQPAAPTHQRDGGQIQSNFLYLGLGYRAVPQLHP